MQVKIYVGKPLKEKFLTEIEVGTGQFKNCCAPRKGDIIIVDDRSYKVKMIMQSYDDDEYVIFVQDYVWGE